MKSRNLNISYSVKRDSDIWQDLKAGSRSALDQIYYAHVPALMAYGRQITANSALVDDCIQELFVDLWVKRERLGNTSSIRFYLFKSLKRRVFRCLQKEEKSKCFCDLGDLFSENPVFHTSGINTSGDSDLETHKKLMDLVENLSPLQKEIIFLKFFNDLSFDEISEVLDLSKKQLYNALSKAMNRLRELLILHIFIVFFLS